MTGQSQQRESFTTHASPFFSAVIFISPLTG
jgi:hypothetical protein